MKRKRRILTDKRRVRRREEPAPMEGVANLVDIMLVFSCALMIALIIYWNVNLNDIVNIIDKSQLVEITDSEIIDQQTTAISDYDSLGTAIQDPDSNTLLIVQDDNIQE